MKIDIKVLLEKVTEIKKLIYSLQETVDEIDFGSLINENLNKCIGCAYEDMAAVKDIFIDMSDNSQYIV